MAMVTQHLTVAQASSVRQKSCIGAFKATLLNVYKAIADWSVTALEALQVLETFLEKSVREFFEPAFGHVYVEGPVF